MEIRIDPEFKTLLWPLTDEERKGLETRLLNEGCRDKLVAWNGILLDGHNRHEICTAHSLPYEVEEIELDSRADAIIWICENQRSRRNATQEQLDYIRGKEYQATKQKYGGTGANQHTKEQSYQNDNSAKPKGKTAQIIADKHGVGYATIVRNGEFAQGIDKIAEFSPAAKEKILSGESQATKTAIRAIAKMDESEVKEAAEMIETDTFVKPKPARQYMPKYHDFMGNPIHVTPEVEEMMKDIDESILIAPTDENYDAVYTIEFAEEEMRSFTSSMIRSTAALLNDRKELFFEPENRRKIIAALSQAETAIKEMRESIL